MTRKKKPTASLVRSSAAEYLTVVAASGTGGVEAVYAAENVWLSQKMMAQLYDVEVPTIDDPLKKVFEDSELEEGVALRSFRITAADGKTYETKHYTLSVIIAVGYKVTLRMEEQVTTRSFQTDDAGALVELEASARAEVVLPADAHVIGEPVAVTQIRYSGVARAGLLATCKRGDATYELSLADVVFPAASAGVGGRGESPVPPLSARAVAGAPALRSARGRSRGVATPPPPRPGRPARCGRDAGRHRGREDVARAGGGAMSEYRCYVSAAALRDR